MRTIFLVLAGGLILGATPARATVTFDGSTATVITDVGLTGPALIEDEEDASGLQSFLLEAESHDSVGAGDSLAAANAMATIKFDLASAARGKIEFQSHADSIKSPFALIGGYAGTYQHLAYIFTVDELSSLSVSYHGSRSFDAINTPVTGEPFTYFLNVVGLASGSASFNTNSGTLQMSLPAGSYVMALDTPYGGSSFAVLTYNTPSFATFDSRAEVRFKITSASAPSVPEPASWVTMICGLGILGAAMRRKPAQMPIQR